MADYNINFTSTGGDQVEQQIQDILKATKSTSSEVLALSRALGISAKEAAAFSAKIGLGAGQAAQVAQKMQSLRKAGLSATEAFRVLQKENGVSAAQYRALTQQIKATEAAQESLTNAQDEAAAASRQSADASAAQQLALQQVNQAAQQLAGALKGLASQAVSEFIAFDDALTSVSAKTGRAKEDLDFLIDAVRETALVTSQSPVSAVKAADSLIALGASAEQAADSVKTVAQLTDALRTVGADAETAAKVVQLGTSIFADFGETAETVGDKIAVVSDTSAAASSTGLQEFLQLFSKAGGLAAQLGVGLDELLANFATLRDAGQAPEVAATSLKSLLSTVLESREKIEALGVTVFDTNEEFVGLTSVFGQLAGKGLGALEIAEVTGALESLREEGISTTETVELFGKIGVASAVALQENYDKTVAATERLADTQGALQAKSDAINSSIQGQATLLQGSLQTALVEVGETLGQFSGPAIGSLLTLVNAFISAPPAIKTFVGATLGLTAALAGAVAAATGLLLTIKALEAAQIGQTIGVVKQTIANAANTAGQIAQNAAIAANTPLRIRQTAATQAQTAATVAQTGAVKASLSAYISLAAAIAGVAAAALLVADTYSTVDKEASTIRSSTQDAAEAQIEYMKALAAAGQAGADATEQIQKSQEELFQSQLNIFQRGLEVVRAAIPGLSTAFEASQGRAEFAFDQLIDKVGETEQAYIDLAQAGFEPGSEAAERLKVAIQAQIDALNNAQLTNEDDIRQRDAQVARLVGYIAKLDGATDATDENTDASAANADATQEAGDAARSAADDFKALEDQLAATTAEIEASTLAAQREAYETLGDDKEGLERRLSQIEEEELVKRLRAQRDHLAKVLGATYESEDAKEKAVAEANKEVAQLELDLAKTQAQRRSDEKERIEKAAEESVRIAEEKAAEEARIAEEQLRTQRAQRDAAFAEERRQIDLTLAQYQLSADQQVRQQEEILRAYDDELDALNRQYDQYKLMAEARNLATRRAIQESDIRLEGLNRAASLLTILNDTEEDTAETRRLAEQELQRLGIKEKTTRLGLLDAILKEEEKRRKAEFEGLIQQQDQERAALAIQQEQERIALRRAETEARINAIKAQQLVVETQIAAVAAQQDVQVAAAALADAQQDGDESAILQAQTALNLAQQNADLVAQQIPVAQEQATLADEQVQKARDELSAYQGIAAQQVQNLINQQQIAREAERSADAAERFAAAMERAQLAGTPEAKLIVGAPEPEARRFGGPVEPGQVYRVNEAGLEGFRPKGSNQIMPLLQPRNSLFTPTVPGDVLSVPQLSRMQSQSASMAGLQAEIKGLRADLANRPVPTLSAPATFVNEPSPLATQIQLLSAQLKAARGIL